MPYYLYKIGFDTPVHFGADSPGIGVEKTSPTCHADTLFSALCLEALHMFGEDFLNQIAEKAMSGSFLLSNLFPFSEDGELFLPKPVLIFNRKQKVEKKREGQNEKKKFKKMKYIPLSRWEEYISFITGETGAFEIRDCQIYEESVQPKVHILRKKENPDDDNQPYHVGSHIFRDGCGLFFVVFLKDGAFKTDLDKIIDSMQYTGIGGERSSGYGKFRLFGDPVKMDVSKDGNVTKLLTMLRSNSSPCYMALSVISPKKGEFTEQMKKDSYYTLIPRNSFIGSVSYSTTPKKKKPIAMFGPGSCFTCRLEGDVKDVSPLKNGGHKVYRYGKAMMMGVEL